MLYTRKGDDGTTLTFGCDQRISKSSNIAEALGSLDEINSFLGLIKIKSSGLSVDISSKKVVFSDSLDIIQQDLFIIQAELAGSDKTITKEKVLWLEEIIDGIEKILPPISTFFVSGGTELSALSDIARTVARRAERRAISVSEEGKISISKETMAYLNRLSSVLYAFARVFNHINGIKEESPSYK